MKTATYRNMLHKMMLSDRRRYGEKRSKAAKGRGSYDRRKQKEQNEIQD